MAKLWLTYAWKDNEDADVDHVIAELVKAGLEVRYDRVQLLAGRRVWEQIDNGMSDPAVDAWAMLVTENSLQSEPCREEISYALNRALATRGGAFPLIGIFAAPLDQSIIPSALATRLYVNLRHPDWAKDVVEGAKGEKSGGPAVPPLPYRSAMHRFGEKQVLEVWPRSGRWCPFIAVVPDAELSKLGTVMTGPRGLITGNGMTSGGDAGSKDRAWQGKAIDQVVDAGMSAHIFLNELPSAIRFGQIGGPMHELKLA